MTAIAKIQDKGQVTIPTRLRALAGLAKGDLVEFSLRRGKIVITPKVVIDRSKFPNADDEYTPEQRRAIDARLDKAMADVKAGRTFGPFNSADEMIEFLHAQVAKSEAKSKRRKTA